MIAVASRVRTDPFGPTQTFQIDDLTSKSDPKYQAFAEIVIIKRD